MAKRDAFSAELARLSEADCVYIDEAGIDNTLAYAYGWSKKGQRCFAKYLGHATERVSMIAAWCHKNVFAPMLFSGTCDSQVVETWFEQVLIPKLRPGQTVILDNASFHRQAKLKALLEPIGCHLLSLPPYSPDLNKIEQLWQHLKTIVSHITDESLSLMHKFDQAFCGI